MIVRLLVVVLTVIGTVPIRICTCGAAHHSASTPAPVPESPIPESTPGVAADPLQQHHDADCHAVKPRPLMSIGLACAVADAPAADGIAVPLELSPQLEPAAGHAVPDVHPPPGPSHFLSYTVLRN